MFASKLTPIFIPHSTAFQTAAIKTLSGSETQSIKYLSSVNFTLCVVLPINWKPFHVLCVCAAFVSLKMLQNNKKTEKRFVSKSMRRNLMSELTFINQLKLSNKSNFCCDVKKLFFLLSFFLHRNKRQHCNERKKAHNCNWRVWFLIFLFITLRIVLPVDVFSLSSPSLCAFACAPLHFSAREATLCRRQAYIVVCFMFWR